MRIGTKIRQVRQQQGLTQKDVETRTGLLKCHVSLIENGHKIPSLETLERIAEALDLPLYRLFYHDSTATLAKPNGDGLHRASSEDLPPGPEKRFLTKLRSLCARMDDSNRDLLLIIAERMAARQAGQNGNELVPSSPLPGVTPGGTSGQLEDEIRRLPSSQGLKTAFDDFHIHLVTFLKVQLSLAAMLAGIALSWNTRAEERTIRTRNVARRSYDTVLRLLPGVKLTDEDTQTIEGGLEVLRSNLKRLGERF
jgi:transcriptional regulator with XRE-family HTH domain